MGSAEPAEEGKLPAASAPEERPRRQPDRLLVGTCLRTLDRDVGEATLLAPEHGDLAGVAAVEVLAEVELAGLVDERRLIGQMHGDQVLELNVLLAAADYAGEPLLGVAIVRPRDREQHLGIFERILDPHAAVAV